MFFQRFQAVAKGAEEAEKGDPAELQPSDLIDLSRILIMAKLNKVEKDLLDQLVKQKVTCRPFSQCVYLLLSFGLIHFVREVAANFSNESHNAAGAVQGRLSHSQKEEAEEEVTGAKETRSRSCGRVRVTILHPST